MSKKIKLFHILLLVIFINVLIVAVAIISSFKPGNIPNWSFSVSDFIQLLVVEIALFGPMVVESWKKKQNRASISFVELNAQDEVENLKDDPYGKIFRIKIINKSDVMLRNCKVLLSDIKVEDKGQSGENKPLISKNINRYLNWHSLDDLVVNLNPDEPASVVIGKLVNKQSIYDGFHFSSHFFEIPYFSKKEQWSVNSELIHQNSVLCLRFFSENADVFCLNIKLTWPENASSEEELVKKFKLETDYKN